MQEQQVIVREGLMLDYPSSTSIIPDPNCKQLKGFLGADWIAQEYYLSTDYIKEFYGVDVGSDCKAYQVTDVGGGYIPAGSAADKSKTMARVWELYDLKNGTLLKLCEGYKGFLSEDLAPPLEFEQGHPFHVILFNDIEDDKNIFPPADVSLLRNQQMEYNRSRESLREHRIASRPAWISPKGMWDENDLQKIGNHMAHEMMQLNIPVSAQLDISKLIIAKPMQAIDANVYDVEFLFTDVLRATGDHEATFGGSSGDTATEVSVAEQSRVSSVESNIDDLDDLLSDVARDSGQILMLNMAPEQVKKIVGPGAIWPQFSAQEAADEIVLSVQAGSSGRPNKAQDLANMERMMPYLIQIPGINPKWIAKQMLSRLDDKADLSEAFVEGMPSITMLNAMSKAGAAAGGAPGAENTKGTASGGSSDPNQQGGQGANNQPNPQQTPPGPQPAFPGMMTQ